MLPLSRLPALGLCLALACGTTPQSPPNDPPPPAAAAAPTTQPALHPLAMMSLLAFAPAPKQQQPPKDPPPRRYVAITDPSKDCPTPLGPQIWDAARLFGSKDATLPLALKKFCVYTAKPSAVVTEKDRLAFRDRIHVEADRDVLYPMGPPKVTHSVSGDTDVRKELAVAYRSSLLAREAAGVDTIYADNSKLPATARVAVVDTMEPIPGSATYEDDKRRRWHGITMAELIGDVRCPSGLAACRSRTSFANAFTGSSDMNVALGSPGSLAAAIQQATKRVAPPKPADPPLVINLSVGWDVEYGNLRMGFSAQDSIEGTDDKTPPNAQAVWTALAYASCHDALIIAAAGNNTGAPCEQLGATAPGRWEKQPAPSRDQCLAWFGIAKAAHRHEGVAPADAASPGPLVYAAGGVQNDDRPIPNARAGSTPRRVLPAMLAVSSERLLSDAWTGTSIAAAALSGIAANVWSYVPSRSPHQIMTLIEASGRDLGRKSELTADANVRRIYAYKAFAALRASIPGAGNQPNNPYLPTAGVTSRTLPDKFPPVAKQTSALDTMIDQLPTMPRRSMDYTCKLLPACTDGGPVRWDCGTGSTRPRAPNPWLRPQPDLPICSICPIKGGKLTLSLNPEAGIREANLSRMFLDLHGDSTIIIPLGPITVPETDVLVDLPYTVRLRSGVSVPLEDVLSTHPSGILSFTYAPDEGDKVSLTSVVTVE